MFMLSRKSLFKYISWEPIFSAARKIKLNKKVAVLMYHEVLDDDEAIDAWTVVKKSDFIKQINYLQNHFKIVSLDDALEIIGNNTPDENLAVITFDDGYKGNYKVVLPIIKSMGIPITVFIATDAVQSQTLYWYDQLIISLQANSRITIDLSHYGLGAYHTGRHKAERKWNEIEKLLVDLKTLMPDKRKGVVEHIIGRIDSVSSAVLLPLSIDEIREMAKSPLVTFGAHSHCHNRLVQLETDKVRESINESKTLLEEWTGRRIRHFAYPNGDYNRGIINILQEAGFVTGFTTISRLWRKDDTAFAIPRMGIGRYDPFGFFKGRISGILI